MRFERLQDRAEQVGAEAVECAKRRILAEMNEPGISAAGAGNRIVLRGRRLNERLRWIGGLFR